MAIEVTIPRLGWSMEEGTFVRWLKQEGDWVSAGDQLFLLESEKATQEIEALDAGVLRLLPTSPAEGATVLVGQVIAVLAAKDEVVAPAGSPAQHPAANGSNGSSTSSAASLSAPPPAGPAARRLARQLNVPLDQVAGSGRGGRVTSDDVHAQARGRSDAGKPTSGAGERDTRGSYAARDIASPTTVDRSVVASPRARRAARNLGVDVGQVQGTGSTGRIRERDVLAAARLRGEVKGSPAAGQSPAGTSPAADKIRRTIARRMVASHQATAPVTLTTKVDATNLVNLRRQFQTAAAGTDVPVPSITDLLARLLAFAIAEHPRLNARWDDDRVVEIAEIRVGIAVDTEVGLLVPVLGDVRGMGVREIAARSKDLVAKARAGTLSSTDLQGGTITITNLGAFGIDAFTPIINPPEAAILGVGAIRREPVFVSGDRVEAREQMTLSLTFDHRVVDGAPAARFLATLRERIENAAAWLAG
jgi:pyruvate dehydrogenase E2 component (dihydrolipoamide acetyltransferase)